MQGVQRLHINNLWWQTSQVTYVFVQLDGYRSTFFNLVKWSKVLFNFCQFCPIGYNSLLLHSHWSQKFGLHQVAITKFQWISAINFARSQWYLTYLSNIVSISCIDDPKKLPSLNKFHSKKTIEAGFGLRKWLAVWISTWDKTQKICWYRLMSFIPW